MFVHIKDTKTLHSFDFFAVVHVKCEMFLGCGSDACVSVKCPEDVVCGACASGKCPDNVTVVHVAPQLQSHIERRIQFGFMS
jgi:hypothetical protein